MISEHTIPKYKLEALQDRISAENKRAKKIGVSLITLEILKEKQEIIKDDITGLDKVREWLEIKITGETPKFSGWTFIATLEKDVATENHLLKAVPGETVPVEYRTVDPCRCNHCNINRYRKKSYIVRHDSGSHKQVGSTCIKDFLGGISPQLIAARMESISELINLCSDEEWSSGGRYVDIWTLDSFLRLASRVIKEFGWISRSKAYDSLMPKEATADTIVNFLSIPSTHKAAEEKNKFFAKIDDSDKEKTKKILEWLPGFFEKKINVAMDGGRHLSDYEWNLKNSTSTGKVSLKTAGLVASIIPLYDREMGIQYQKKDKPVSEHIGEIKEKIQIKVTPVYEKFIEGDYGTTHMIKFEDESGNSLVWFASREQDIEMGELYQMKATIKAHNQYNGKKETAVTRAKLEKVEK